MTSIVYLDLETCPADPDTFTADVSAPSNYKDPEKIAAYIAEAQKEAHGKTSFDVHRGRLLCAAVAVGDDAPTVAYDATLSNPGAILDLVADACAHAAQNGHGRFTVCGHNIAGFDVPWLWRLAVKHRHRLARILPYRKWGDGLADTMLMWSQTNPTDKVRLDTIARFLGYAGKEEGMSGAEVWPAYLRGEHDRIATYCAKDVEMVRAIYLRMTGNDPVGF
jgi:3'-5' exonuclease